MVGKRFEPPPAALQEATPLESVAFALLRVGDRHIEMLGRHDLG
jgi:hypothetical protein